MSSFLEAFGTAFLFIKTLSKYFLMEIYKTFGVTVKYLLVAS